EHARDLGPLDRAEEAGLDLTRAVRVGVRRDRALELTTLDLDELDLERRRAAHQDLAVGDVMAELEREAHRALAAALLALVVAGPVAGELDQLGVVALDGDVALRSTTR